MEKKQNISLELNNSSGVYFPGQTISGKVTINLDEPKECINLHVQLLGEGEVRWTGQRTGSNVQETYSAKEEYLNSEIILKQPEDGTNKLVLPSGSYTYPFNGTFPTNLPSSFNSITGRVTYSVIARIKRPWYKFDIKDVRVISMIGILDLNYMELKDINGEPIPNGFFLEKSKTVCCLCCASGPVKMDISLPKVTYVPGEDIKFSVDMSNNSSRSVSKTLCQFIQVATFLAEGQHKTVEVCIETLNGPSLSRRLSETWNERISPLRVPPVPPTGLAGPVKIINVQYVLRFQIKLKGPSLSLTGDAPLKVGTIPLRSTFSDFKPSLNNDSDERDQFSNNLFARESNQANGIFGVAATTGIYPSMDAEQSPSSKPPILILYPDLPSFKIMKSVINLDRMYSNEYLEKMFGDYSDKQQSNESRTYHPSCIYYENLNASFAF